MLRREPSTAWHEAHTQADERGESRANCAVWLISASMEKVYELLDIRPDAVTLVTFI